MELEKDVLKEDLFSELDEEREDVTFCLNCERPFEERHGCEICNGLCFEKNEIISL